jgi:leader peptidase (prepilin peptidase)/N-methyltransferase
MTALEPPIFPWVALTYGLILGSFANVCIHRLPLGASVLTPRSRCPHCGAPIAAWDNVPVLSYLVLLGRCRACRSPISARYPLVELVNGVLYFLIARAMGPAPLAFVSMLFATALLILTLVDLDHHLLPDRVTFPGIALGLAKSFLPGASPQPVEAFASALGGYVLFMIVAKSYEKTRGVEGLGQGDWKMAAMLGAFFGWQKLLLVVLAATLAGSVVGLVMIVARGKTAQYALPLGTFLGLAAMVALLVGDPVLVWYRGLLRG